MQKRVSHWRRPRQCSREISVHLLTGKGGTRQLATWNRNSAVRSTRKSFLKNTPCSTTAHRATSSKEHDLEHRISRKSSAVIHLQCCNGCGSLVLREKKELILQRTRPQTSRGVFRKNQKHSQRNARLFYRWNRHSNADVSLICTQKARKTCQYSH